MSQMWSSQQHTDKVQHLPEKTVTLSTAVFLTPPASTEAGADIKYKT